MIPYFQSLFKWYIEIWHYKIDYFNKLFALRHIIVTFTNYNINVKQKTLPYKVII